MGKARGLERTYGRYIELYSLLILECSRHHALVNSRYASLPVTQARSSWIDSAAWETSERTIDLSEYDVDIIDALVEYMYNFDYNSSMKEAFIAHTACPSTTCSSRSPQTSTTSNC